jgi:hypothetical protein
LTETTLGEQPSIYKALGSILSITKRRGREGKERGEGKGREERERGGTTMQNLRVTWTEVPRLSEQPGPG